MSNLPPDPWKVLGIEKSADKSEVRTAYRKLVLKCHPDKVQDPTLKAQKQDEFQKVQQAYELLNDDTERAKYEEQLKLAEMRKAAMLSKNMPNISASRTPPRSSHTFYDVRTAEPASRFRHASPHQSSPVPPSGKVYTHVYASSKSYEDEVSPRSQTVYDEDRRARRTASYEQPSRRDDEKREERKRREARDRKDEEDRERERERRDKELRKQDRREREKIRDKEKRRDVEDKTSRRTGKEPYLEEYHDRDIREVYPPTVKVEKKKISPSSGSKKVDEPREKSSSRRERDESPRTHDYLKAKEEAAAYIERQRAKSKPAAPSLGRAQTFQQPPTYARVPSPPPPAAEYVDDEVVRRSSARPSRRSSNDLGVRSKERPYPASQKKSREDFEVVDALPRADRAGPPRSERIIPMLKKANTMPTTMTPPVVPESPPRHPPRHNTAQETYSRPPPAMPGITRSSTYAPGDRSDRFPDVIRGVYEGSDDDAVYEDRRRHRSRRTHSPEAATTTRRYKARGVTVEPVHEPDVYDHYDDYRSSRRHGSSYGAKVEPGGRGGPDYYYDPQASTQFSKVKTSKAYTPDDVTYSDLRYPASQGWGGVVA
ncbi:DnaJ-domain-containing protein [Coniochaeta ligniaria NRRL 30616]|uniref:DnaJ-domain-containing protein n=1 Tax=Coniochaeta ligniaria NRRL 30616 TaxID=1408157 RepID=A0A1J7JJL5_9PEZI|nr:DnaJ-domain-containing protein [Coniochaeta ligniaria NRRL 30616]